MRGITWTTRSVALLVATTGALALTSTSAIADVYPINSPTVAAPSCVDSSTATFPVTLDGFGTTESITVSLSDGQTKTRVSIGTVTFSVPTSGSYMVNASGSDGHSAGSSVLVAACADGALVAPPVPPAGGSPAVPPIPVAQSALPTTGTDSISITRIAAVTLLTGLGLALLALRRRRTSPAPA